MCVCTVHALGYVYSGDIRGEVRQADFAAIITESVSIHCQFHVTNYFQYFNFTILITRMIKKIAKNNGDTRITTKTMKINRFAILRAWAIKKKKFVGQQRISWRFNSR